MTQTPTAKRSRYSSSLNNVTLRQRYEAQLREPSLLSSRDEIGLLDARLGSLLSQIEGQGTDFLSLMAAVQQINGFAHKDDMESIIGLLPQLNDVVTKGVIEGEIWKEAYQVIEQRRKLVDTEMKTISTIGAMLSMDTVIGYINKIMAGLELYVQDKQAIADMYLLIEKTLDLTPRALRSNLDSIEIK